MFIYNLCYVSLGFAASHLANAIFPVKSYVSLDVADTIVYLIISCALFSWHRRIENRRAELPRPKNHP